MMYASIVEKRRLLTMKDVGCSEGVKSANSDYRKEERRKREKRKGMYSDIRGGPRGRKKQQ